MRPLPLLTKGGSGRIQEEKKMSTPQNQLIPYVIESTERGERALQ